MSQVDTRIVGVDCATEPRKVGLALADLRAGTLVVKNSRCASKDSRPSAIVAEWLRTSDRALIALDAPLGWPAALSEALRRHSAGAPVAVTADQMFRRLTDDEIYRRLSKRPMDVGADRIARTARAALQLLDELTLAIGSGLELVWSPDFRTRIGAIEVYPAATRISLGVAAGSGSLRGLTSRVKFDRGAPPRSKDARDAIVCALAGAEFLLGRAVPPTSSQEPLARREGWIWAGGLPHPTSARKTDRGKTLVRPREPSAASDARTVAKALSAPRRLWEPEELLQNPCPIPCESGLYGWYFRNLPSVPVSGCQAVDGFRLIYVGIAPANAESHSTMRQRICENHLQGNASGSTLRLSLGCLLGESAGIVLQYVNDRFHFADGESKLSAWMRRDARVAWVAHPRPWDIESPVIGSLDLPLNLDHNSAHPFYVTLKSLRRRCRQAARTARQTGRA